MPEKQKKEKRRISIRISAAAVLLIIVIALIAVAPRFLQTTSTTTITSTMLKNSLEQASDLVATKYYYSNVGKFENSHEINGWSIPFTSKSFLLTYQGEALLGIDTSKTDVKIQGDTIIVDCPAVEVLSNSIDPASVEVYDESSSIFNPISVEDFTNFEVEELEAAEQKMIEDGVLEKTQENVASCIESLFSVIPGVSETYTIEVNFPS